MTADAFMRGITDLAKVLVMEHKEPVAEYKPLFKQTGEVKAQVRGRYNRGQKRVFL